VKEVEIHPEYAKKKDVEVDFDEKGSEHCRIWKRTKRKRPLRAVVRPGDSGSLTFSCPLV
jgi:hypothetical protein